MSEHVTENQLDGLQYRVVYTGMLNKDPEARARLVEFLVAGMGVPREKAWTLVNSTRCCVKRSCPSDTAQRLGDRLRQWGAQVVIEPLAPPPQATTQTPAQSVQKPHPLGADANKPGPAPPPPNKGTVISEDPPPEIEEIPRQRVHFEESKEEPEEPIEDEVAIMARVRRAATAFSFSADGETQPLPADVFESPTPPPPRPPDVEAAVAPVRETECVTDREIHRPRPEQPPIVFTVTADPDSTPAAAAAEDSIVPLLGAEFALPEAAFPEPGIEELSPSQDLPPEWAVVCAPAGPPVQPEPMEALGVDEDISLPTPRRIEVQGLADTDPLEVAATAVPVASPRMTETEPPPVSRSFVPPLPPELAPAADLPVQDDPLRIRCTECGSMEPAEAKACSRCFFPIGRKKKAVRPPADAESLEDTEAAPPEWAAPQLGVRSQPGVVPHAKLGTGIATSNALGHGALEQCYAPVLTCSLLLWGYAAANLIALVRMPELVPKAAITSSIIDIILGIALLKGSAGARTWILARAVLGALVWGGIGLAKGDLAGLIFQLIYSASLLILLIGRGSMLKALLVGIPNALILGLAALGLSVGAPEPADLHLLQGQQYLQQERWNEALTEFKAALEKTSPSDTTRLAQAHFCVGAAHLGKEDIERAVPELEDAVHLDGKQADSRFLLALAYFRVGRSADSLRQLQVVREMDASYPNLEQTEKLVRASIQTSYY